MQLPIQTRLPDSHNAMHPTAGACSSFLKWAGGKRAAVPQLLRQLPDRARFARCYEPFVGDSVLFLEIKGFTALFSAIFHHAIMMPQPGNAVEPPDAIA